MKFRCLRFLVFLGLIFWGNQKAFAQDSVYISTGCFEELNLRCFMGKGDSSSIVRIKIKKRLIKKDLEYLKKVQEYIKSEDTAWTYRVSETLPVERRRRRKSDSTLVANGIYLNYFNVKVYTFFVGGKVFTKMAIVNNARTFYCNYDDIKKAHNYSLIDPVFFERYLKPSFKISYSYNCGEIYLGRFGVPWGLFE